MTKARAAVPTVIDKDSLRFDVDVLVRRAEVDIPSLPPRGKLDALKGHLQQIQPLAVECRAEITEFHRERGKAQKELYELAQAIIEHPRMSVAEKKEALERLSKAQAKLKAQNPDFTKEIEELLAEHADRGREIRVIEKRSKPKIEIARIVGWFVFWVDFAVGAGGDITGLSIWDAAEKYQKYFHDLMYVAAIGLAIVYVPKLFELRKKARATEKEADALKTMDRLERIFKETLKKLRPKARKAATEAEKSFDRDFGNGKRKRGLGEIAINVMAFLNELGTTAFAKQLVAKIQGKEKEKRLEQDSNLRPIG